MAARSIQDLQEIIQSLRSDNDKLVQFIGQEKLESDAKDREIEKMHADIIKHEHDVDRLRELTGKLHDTLGLRDMRIKELEEAIISEWQEGRFPEALALTLFPDEMTEEERKDMEDYQEAKQ